ncbi:MAG: pilus assembly protein PilM [Deltaproteobacteria bacterium]|nr:pilus assembly protein PilM [Deltaproteobacteria bacterium]
MPQKTIGVDIGNTGISALLLEGSLSGFRIGGYRHIPFNGGLSDLNAVIDVLKTALRELPLTGVRCAASIPAREFFFRNLRLPAFEPKKIQPILPFELEPLLPFPAEDVVTDFDVFKDPQRPDQTDIVTATIRKADLDAWLDVYRAAGIAPEIVTFKGYALARCLAETLEVPGDWILVDVDLSTVTLFLFKSGQPLFLRCTTVPSEATRPNDALVSAVRQTLWNVEAVFPFDYRPEAIRINFNRKAPDQAGCKLLETHFDIPVESVDLIETLKMKTRLPMDLPEDASGVDAALSLALMKRRHVQGMQFLRGAYSPKTRFSEYRFDILSAGGLLVMALILAGAYFFLDMRIMEKRSAQLNAFMTQAFQAAFSEEKVIVDPLGQMKAKLENLKKRSLLAENQRPRIRRIDLLKEISRLVPEGMDVNVSRLTVGDEDLVITGTTDTFTTVNTMKRSMESSALFKEVTISSANQNRSGNRVDFVLTIRF